MAPRSGLAPKAYVTLKLGIKPSHMILRVYINLGQMAFRVGLYLGHMEHIFNEF